ncbi:hypothetical protein scyTo_0009608 [Scyliorhinus torazame]|uniref:Uncharacterized protein n=1 Tax=Scyliorhinus torazame TaxID=75743 RepID=A0A401NQ52_SCYTO|nr:hypothetical protein [Scyliorhinus torazame]
MDSGILRSGVIAFNFFMFPVCDNRCGKTEIWRKSENAAMQETKLICYQGLHKTGWLAPHFQFYSAKNKDKTNTRLSKKIICTFGNVLRHGIVAHDSLCGLRGLRVTVGNYLWEACAHSSLPILQRRCGKLKMASRYPACPTLLT